MEHVVIVHGIRDNDAWGQRIADRLKGRNRSTYTYSFNYFSLFSFVNPLSRAAATRRMLEVIEERIGGKLSPKDSISFVGHSFGTYLIFRFVERFHTKYRIRNVAFISSVLHSLVAPKTIGRSQRFCNFAATKDWVLLLNNLLPFPSAGLAGRIGCAGYASDKDNRDAFFPTDHGGWFRPREDHPDADWFIGGALRSFFLNRSFSSEVERPKVAGWLATLFNVYKLVLPAIFVMIVFSTLHVLRHDDYVREARDLLAEANISNPFSVRRLAQFDVDFWHTLLGWDASTFLDTRFEILARFLDSNNISRLVHLKDHRASISIDGQSALIVPISGDGPIISVTAQRVVLVREPGSIIPGCAGYFACQTESLTIVDAVAYSDSPWHIEAPPDYVWPPLPDGFECDELSGFVPYTNTGGFAVGRRVVHVDGSARLNASAPLVIPPLNDISPEEQFSGIRPITDFEGLVYSPAREDGDTPISNLHAGETIANAFFEIDREDTTFIVDANDLTWFAPVLKPTLMNATTGDEVEGWNEVDRSKSVYQSGSRLLYLTCSTDTCELRGIQLPNGRSVGQIRNVHLDVDCKIVVVFQGVDEAFPLLDLPHLCAESRIPTEIDAPTPGDRHFYGTNDQSTEVLAFTESAELPATRPRHEFSDLLARVACDYVMPGQNEGSFRANQTELQYVCGSTIDATVDWNGIQEGARATIFKGEMSWVPFGQRRRPNEVMLAQARTINDDFGQLVPAYDIFRWAPTEYVEDRVIEVVDAIEVPLEELFRLSMPWRDPIDPVVPPPVSVTPVPTEVEDS